MTADVTTTLPHAEASIDAGLSCAAVVTTDVTTTLPDAEALIDPGLSCAAVVTTGVTTIQPKLFYGRVRKVANQNCALISSNVSEKEPRPKRAKRIPNTFQK